MLNQIREKVEAGERIEREEGLFLLREAHLLDLAPLAQTWRFRHNPEPAVTFVVDTNLNYTNVCDAFCTFCAFYRTPADRDAYTYSVEEMMEKFEQSLEKGVTRILLQGGLNDALPLEYYEELLRESQRRYPQIHCHFFSAPEVQKMSQVSGLSVREVLQRLKAAGLKSLPGGGSEVLSDRVKQKVSRLFPKGSTQDWVEVHREAHRLGIATTATMMYGHLEEDDDIIEHLEVVRQLQDETHGFLAFIPWSFKKAHTALDRRVKEEAGPNRYLRIMALSRIYLDNVQHIQASWFSEWKKVGQVALHFGGDDFGGTLFDENVMQEAGFYNRTTVDEVVAIIREAGFIPVERGTLYEFVRSYGDEAAAELGSPTAVPASVAGGRRD
ncbi:MAG TPA: cyclic dehypoxanthinyl futalosine synthase [Dehalococcoidia bacterium]|nr:cyclic dehypoxanthinyl futalosine synthase [Dehalococcoidia bacterium]